MSLALLGPSAWRVCAQEDVQYKTDCHSPNPDHEQLRAAEVFSRVTIWNGEASVSRDVKAEEKLAVILKLESTDESLPNLEWTYFDLQDLVTPGLDRRPWFSTLDRAINANQSSKLYSHSSAASRKTQDRSGNSSPENPGDYWAGVSSSDESATDLNQPSPTNPSSEAHVRSDHPQSTHSSALFDQHQFSNFEGCRPRLLIEAYNRNLHFSKCIFP